MHPIINSLIILGGRGGSIFQNAKIGFFFHWFVLEIKILHSSSGSKWHQYPASWFFINTDCCKRSRHKLHVATWSKDISCQTFQIKEEKHANHSCHTCNEMLLDIIMDEYISINVLASYILSKVQDFILIFFFFFSLFSMVCQFIICCVFKTANKNQIKHYYPISQRYCC